MFIQDLQKVIKQNIRQYGMYIALFVIMTIFTFATPNFSFISSRNISNLLNQTGYIAVLAVGMTLVIVIRHIDLSVGYLAGFLGAVAAISMVSWKLPVFVVIPMVLLLGAIAGMITAFPVAQLKIPAFVASLAGWLIYRGALLLSTAATGTIIIPDPIFNAIGNGYVPDLPFPKPSPEVLDTMPTLLAQLASAHKLTLILGVITIIAFIISDINSRNKKMAYNFEVLPFNIFILKLVFISALIALITVVLSGYNGISWTLVIVLLVVAVYQFMTTQTVLGRHIYAVGGNPEAAELSGISVKRITYIVFASMGTLTALSGILFASRLQSATTTAGSLFEMDAIASAYIGGVSAAGGVGSIMGSLIGALVYMSLTSGMNLMNIDIAYQYIVRGAVLVAAVVFDVATRSRGK